MSKYQKALNKIVENSCPRKTSCQSCEISSTCNSLMKYDIDTLQELVSMYEKIDTKDKLYEEFLENVNDILCYDEYEDNIDILNGILNLFNGLLYRLGEIE